MKAIWSGSISIGLVNIPIKLYKARRDKTIHFRLLCPYCHSPLRNKRYCEKCDKEIGWDDALRGYEYEKGKFVIITDEDLQNVPLRTMKTIEIKQFADWVELDPIHFKQFYYLKPQEGFEKPYLLLKEALARTGKIAVGKVTIRNKEMLVAIKPYGDYLVMVSLYYADEIVDAEKELGPVATSEEISAEELKLAEELIEALTKKLKIEEYKSDYREAFMKLIEAKIAGKEVEVPMPSQEAKSLLEALKISVEQIKKKKKKEEKA